MIKFNQLNNSRYNQLGKSKFNTPEFIGLKKVYDRLVNSRPIILDDRRRMIAVLDNADDVILEQDVEGIDQLTFTLPWKDEKREYIKNEVLIQMFDSIYIIRDISPRRSSMGPPGLEVYAEAIWYDLQFKEPVDQDRWETVTPKTVITDILKGTGWRPGTITITRRRTPEFEKGVTNRLTALRRLESLYGGELTFNSDTMTIDFTEPIGRQSGAAIVYGKNMDSIEASYNTEELITKLYLLGKEGMTIAAANDGVTYLEDYSYTKHERVRVIKDERFTNPYHLKERGEDALKVLARPRSSYIITAYVLSILSGMSHEDFRLGDIIRVYDKELGIDINTRILYWKYNVIRPWETEIQLESTQPTLSELLTGNRDGDAFLTSTDSVESGSRLDLSVYNLLLNSRADDGFSYWQNTGWEIDAINGFSGNASFKVEGGNGEKVISQTVIPSHQENYSISFRAATEGLELLKDGRIGVEVTLHYTDGDSEVVFIPLAEEE